MATRADKKTYTFKIILYTILFLGNIWCAIDSFCEYAGTLKTKTLIKGLYFLVFIFFFAWRAIVDFKLHKIKRNEDDI